ncbi:MAG: NfeD family protein, partial [Desulfomonilaceae bacterium]
PTGKVFTRGEYWNARSDVRILKGSTVRVTGVKDLEVTVTMVL